MTNTKQAKTKREITDYDINSWMCSPEAEQVERAERAERVARDTAELADIAVATASKA